MKALYVRIHLTLIVVLAAFALGGSAWLFQRQIEQERGNAEVTPLPANGWRPWPCWLQRALPPASDARARSCRRLAAIEEWGQRLRMALALAGCAGQAHRRLRSSSSAARRCPGQRRRSRSTLDDGRHIAWSSCLAASARPARRRGDLRQGAEAWPDARRMAGDGPDRAPSACACCGARMPPGVARVLLGPRLLHGQGLAIVLVLLFVGIAVPAPFPWCGA